MSLYRNIGALIEEVREMQDELLGEEPSKEREIEVALATQRQFVQLAFLEVARELDALRAAIEDQGQGSRG
jgi:hypothetical protein